MIENRVAKSPLITIDLEDYYHKGARVEFDIAPNLYQGLILKEADFRAFVKDHDWSQYEGKNVAVFCSKDAIVPTWAFMLLTTKLEGVANMVVMGDLQILEFVHENCNAQCNCRFELQQIDKVATPWDTKNDV